MPVARSTPRLLLTSRGLQRNYATRREAPAKRRQLTVPSLDGVRVLMAVDDPRHHDTGGGDAPLELELFTANNVCDEPQRTVGLVCEHARGTRARQVIWRAPLIRATPVHPFGGAVGDSPGTARALDSGPVSLLPTTSGPHGPQPRSPRHAGCVIRHPCL